MIAFRRSGSVAASLLHGTVLERVPVIPNPSTMVVPEPITITLAVVGLLKATWSVSKCLNDFVKGIEKAPKEAVIALAEVKAVTAILRQLQSYLDGKDPVANARASLLTLEEIVATLTDCVCTFSEFETLLNGMKTADMGPIDRVTWNWNKSKVAKLVARIQTQKSSLSTMFAILTWCGSPSRCSAATTANCARLAKAKKKQQHPRSDFLVLLRNCTSRTVNS